MRLGFIALLSRDQPMAIGDTLNPDCTVRACRIPQLFMSILAQQLHPVVIAALIACRASLRRRESLASMSRTRTGISQTWNRDGRACCDPSAALVEHPAILNEHEK